MPVITEIDDLKRIYRRRVPKMFFDYTESGSWTEQTFRENVSDFDLIRLLAAATPYDHLGALTIGSRASAGAVGSDSSAAAGCRSAPARATGAAA